MVYRRVVPAMAWILTLALYTAAGLADEPCQQQQESRFFRLVRDEEGSPLSLEVAIVRCVPMDCGQTSPTVDLIGAVHVAEKAYYGELNRQFEQYDAVLYELVAPEGTRIPKGGVGLRSSSPVSMLQSMMTDMLELEFQLQGIDYTRENLVHADMSPQKFAQSMNDRGESMLQVFFRLMGYAMTQQNKAGGMSDFQLLAALFSRDRALALKKIMAEQFEDLEGSLTAISGPEGSTLITERNKVALEVLRKQLAAGKKNVAIFYGAGHMPDFQQRLRENFGLVPISTTWLVAWNLTAASEAPSPGESPAETGLRSVPTVPPVP